VPSELGGYTSIALGYLGIVITAPPSKSVDSILLDLLFLQQLVVPSSALANDLLLGGTGRDFDRAHGRVSIHCTGLVVDELYISGVQNRLIRSRILGAQSSLHLSPAHPSITASKSISVCHVQSCTLQDEEFLNPLRFIRFSFSLRRRSWITYSQATSMTLIATTSHSSWTFFHDGGANR